MKGEKKKTSARSRWTRFTFHLSLLTCLLSLAGCDESFQPLRENDAAPFSIFGYLDASADTQWVRVTPVRDQLDLPPVVPEMHVTIEHPQSGSMAEMNDSLFLFPDGFHILNAWAVTDILKPEQTYRLRAERPDGAASHVTVTLPDDFPTPTLEIYEIVGLAFVNIKGVERLADVQIKTRARIISPSAGWDYVRVFSTSQKRRIDEVAPGEYRVMLSISTVLSFVHGLVPAPPNNDLVVEPIHRQIFVASGGPEWDEEISTLDDRIYSLPNVISNVENGTGYLFGIVSKSIPYKSCFNDQEELIACPEEEPL